MSACLFLGSIRERLSAMYLRTEKRTDRRHGTTAILLCLCMTGILFLTAMAIDLGNLMAARRHAQNCCDAAALAGCIQLTSVQAQGQTPSQSSINDAVIQSANSNNYTDGSNCTITVNWPPQSGNFQDKNSVEVL